MQGKTCRFFQLQFDRAPMQQVACIVQLAADHFVDHEVLHAQAVVRLARKDQQSFHQRAHFAARALDALHRALPELTQRLLVRQHIGRHPDHRQRATQFMAGIACELALALIITGDASGELPHALGQLAHLGRGTTRHPVLFPTGEVRLAFVPATQDADQVIDWRPLTPRRQPTEHADDPDERQHGSQGSHVERAHQRDDDQCKQLQTEYQRDTPIVRSTLRTLG